MKVDRTLILAQLRKLLAGRITAAELAAWARVAAEREARREVQFEPGYEIPLRAAIARFQELGRDTSQAALQVLCDGLTAELGG